MWLGLRLFLSAPFLVRVSEHVQFFNFFFNKVSDNLSFFFKKSSCTFQYKLFCKSDTLEVVLKSVKINDYPISQKQMSYPLKPLCVFIEITVHVNTATKKVQPYSSKQYSQFTMLLFIKRNVSCSPSPQYRLVYKRKLIPQLGPLTILSTREIKRQTNQ